MAGMTGAPASGLVIVDKPAGLTSHDVVARIRRLAGTRRVGHAGTLDPMATGVLVVGIEKATRLLGHLALTEKEYAATIRLGQAHRHRRRRGRGRWRPLRADGVTDDAARGGAGGADRRDRAGAAAVQRDQGRRPARLRAGPGRARPPSCAARTVTVSRLRPRRRPRRGPAAELLDVDVAVDCSSGTYIRALARDLGAGPRHRRAPDRAAPDPGRPVPDRATRAPWTSWPSGADPVPYPAGRGRGRGLPAPGPDRRRGPAARARRPAAARSAPAGAGGRVRAGRGADRAADRGRAGGRWPYSRPG